MPAKAKSQECVVCKKVQLKGKNVVSNPPLNNIKDILESARERKENGDNTYEHIITEHSDRELMLKRYHTTCREVGNKTKIARLGKRKSLEAEEPHCSSSAIASKRGRPAKVQAKLSTRDRSNPL